MIYKNLKYAGTRHPSGKELNGHIYEEFDTFDKLILWQDRNANDGSVGRLDVLHEGQIIRSVNWK